MGCRYTHLRCGCGNLHCFACESMAGWTCYGAGGGGVRNFLCGYLSVEAKHMNLISSKIAKHVDLQY